MDQRSRSWRTTSDLMAAAVPDVEIEPRIEVRCKVCTLPDRGQPNGVAVANLVEELLLVPKTYASIMRLIEPLLSDWPQEARFSKYSLIRHARRHTNFERAAYRTVADRRARDDGRREDAAGRMLSAAVVLETVQQRGIDLLLQDELRPSVRDVLTATTTLRDLEREADSGISSTVLLGQLDDIIQAVRDEVPPELWPRIVARMERGTDAPVPPSADPVWDGVAAELEGLVPEAP